MSHKEFILREFNSLGVRELYEIYRLRAEVFVVEQHCAYQDVDEKDPEALHYMIFEGEKLLAYCRILAPGISYKECAIGRVVVSPARRGQELGKLLMNNAVRLAQGLFAGDVVLSAQTYLLRFYNDLGFVAEGDEYAEDDIPHVKMRLRVLS